MSQSTQPKPRDAATLGMATQFGLNVLRVAWYTAVHRFADRRVEVPVDATPRPAPARPVPTFRELMRAIIALAARDAEAVRDGICPPQEAISEPPSRYFARLTAMLRDMPEAARRRATRTTTSVREHAGWQDLPDYYTQDFHFQDGGHLADTSARLYDVQVETLFNGSARLMRRAALEPIVGYVRDHDQRNAALVDIACGTGRFLRELRLAFPRLGLTGIDLSPAYLAEAERHLRGLRPAELVVGNAEQLPLDDASQDIATAIFLFHELPANVRRRVAGEVARILKPGGLVVYVDSLQYGDKPDWDGLLEAFPARFHEPYYHDYCTDDLDAVFDGAGLCKASQHLAFVSKVMVWRKPSTAAIREINSAGSRARRRDRGNCR
jgi:ubiquinone/menaquinone biosynthesis C-methylase UbiE